MMRVWERISELGTDYTTDVQEKKNIILCNRVSAMLLVMVVILATSMSTLFSSVPQLMFRGGYAIFIGAFPLLLNRLGYILLSRVYLSVAVPIGTPVAILGPKLYENIPLSVYDNFMLPVIYMAACVIPMIIINYRREKKLLYGVSAFYLVMILSNEVLFYSLGYEVPESVSNVFEAVMLNMHIVMAFVFVALGYIFLNNVNAKYEASLEERHLELQDMTENLRASEEELRQNMEELQTTHEALEEKTYELDIHNAKMTKSIQYGKTIQRAVLPSEVWRKNVFPESFLIYRPKDIVSGDFYWFSRHGDKRLAAVIDCTGHGVPGAFMSLVGNNILSELILQRGIIQPAEILTTLHKRIQEKLHQHESENNDGMDLGFCLLEDLPDGQVQVTYSGAKHILYIVGDGAVEVLRSD